MEVVLFEVRELNVRKSQVDANGFVDLANTLKVSKGFGKKVFLCVVIKGKVIFKHKFVTESRVLAPVTKIFKNCKTGSQLENVVFEVMDPQGEIDESIHDEDKHGQSHTLTIHSDSLEVDDNVRYSFRHGRCTIPSIPLPRREGSFSLSAVHSCYPELNAVVKVQVENTRVENARMRENNQVLRRSPSSNSQGTRGMSSPQSSQNQVHAENAQEGSHISTRNHEGTTNFAFSNKRPCEILRRSPPSNVPKETQGAFSARSSQKQVSLNSSSPAVTTPKSVNVENARKENATSSNNTLRGDDQFRLQSPVSLGTDEAFSPRRSSPAFESPKLLQHVDTPLQVHVENREESSSRAGGNDQLLQHTRSSRETNETLSTPSSMKLIPYNGSSPVFTTQKMELPLSQIGNSATQNLGSSSLQEIADALLKSGNAVTDHYWELSRLRFRRRQIHVDITNLQASLGRDFDFVDVSTTPTCDKESVLKQIESKKESAASVMCKRPFESRPQGILGVVALLGTVQSVELSRMLAEYLGEDQMLAIACKNYKAAYHLKANNLGEAINRGYHAVCLEDIRPRFVERSSDPQQLLPLEAPVFPNGSVPLGFLGYAVNLIDIEDSFKEWRTETGYGLRETLLYRLFGELQVYKDEQSMFSAQPCIKEGALSLDGCIIRGNGLISLGHREPPEILFPVHKPLSPEALHAMQSLEEKKLEMEELDKRVDEEQKAYVRAKEEFGIAQEKYNMLKNGSGCSW